MTEIRFRGLIVRETMLGEADKLISVLTPEYGRIPVMAKGARSLRSPNMLSTQLMCYAEMTVYKKGEYYWLRESLPIESFYPIRLEIDCFALVQYMFDVCCEVCPERHSDGAEEMERLLLNTLYAIMTNKKDQRQLKAAFELKAAALSGFAPDLSGCCRCGGELQGEALLDLVGGTVTCGGCVKKNLSSDSASPRDSSNATAAILISPPVLRAMRYVTEAELKRFVAFSLPDEYMEQFCSACEGYLCNQLERGFETLVFWHEMRAEYEKTASSGE